MKPDVKPINLQCVDGIFQNVDFKNVVACRFSFVLAPCFFMLPFYIPIGPRTNSKLPWYYPPSRPRSLFSPFCLLPILTCVRNVK